ncbi:MAG: catalase [Clostridia bacterium]|nr:catalase [Clostridia bacterium]
MKLTNIFKHFWLIVRHKHKVFIHCCKCGIVWRGIVHDLSKFSPTEFFESVKYFKGYRSPIGVCRREKGVSLAWLHHKGRNKHHIEYWLDPDCPEPPLMPYKYAVECVCDKLAATKIYKGKDYSPEMALDHWTAYGSKVAGNPKTMKFVETVFTDLKELGEKRVFNKKYMKETYARICE